MPENNNFNITTTRTRTSRIFYGWFSLIGVMLIVFMVGGIFINTFGVFLPVLADDLSWSRGTVALALSLGMMAFGLPSPFFGVLVARFGPRKTLIWGNLVAALGIASLALVQEVWHLYVLYSIIGFGAGLGGYISGATLVTNWFVKKRSLVLGMFTACGGLGGFVFPPIATALIDSIGWRLTWVTLAGVIIIVGVLLGGAVLVRNKPEDMGLLPDGKEPTPEDELKSRETVVPAVKHSIQSGLKELVKHRAVWLIGGFAAANAFAMGTMNTHQAAYVQDFGFSPMTAATTMSLLAGLSFVGGITFGALALKIKVKQLTLGGFIIMLVAVTILLTSQELPMIYVYTVLLGLGNGALTTAMPTFVGLYYHGDRYARAIGIILPLQTIAQAVSASIAGSVYDATGSYTPAFILVGGFIAAGLMFVIVSRVPRNTL